MSTYTFKTNIHCTSRVVKAAPHLSAEPALRSWQVDTTHANKLLTVDTPSLSPSHLW